MLAVGEMPDILSVENHFPKNKRERAVENLLKSIHGPNPDPLPERQQRLQFGK